MKVVFKKIERCCSIQLEDQCINALAHERSDLNINIAQVLNANAQVGARGAFECAGGLIDRLMGLMDP